MITFKEAKAIAQRCIGDCVLTDQVKTGYIFEEDRISDGELVSGAGLVFISNEGKILSYPEFLDSEYYNGEFDEHDED